MKLFLKKNQGFTLIETIVSLGIGILIMTGMMAVIPPVLKNIRETRQEENLHKNAALIINKLNYLIKKSDILTVESTTQLKIKPELKEMVIEITENNIVMKVSGESDVFLNTDDIKISAYDSDGSGPLPSNPIFTEMSKSVIIEFTIQSKSGVSDNIKTTIARRN